MSSQEIKKNVLFVYGVLGNLLLYYALAKIIPIPAVAYLVFIILLGVFYWSLTVFQDEK